MSERESDLLYPIGQGPSLSKDKLQPGRHVYCPSARRLPLGAPRQPWPTQVMSPYSLPRQAISSTVAADTAAGSIVTNDLVCIVFRVCRWIVVLRDSFGLAVALLAGTFVVVGATVVIAVAVTGIVLLLAPYRFTPRINNNRFGKCA